MRSARSRAMSDLKSYVTSVVPFWRHLGLELIEAADGHATFEAAFRPEHLQNGVMHGGVLAALVDSACACAALSRTWPEAYAATIGLSMQYLKPVTGGRLRARAECLRAGRTILYCEARVWNEAGEIVCTGTSQLSRIPLRAPGR